MSGAETNQRESIREYMRMPTKVSFCLAVVIFVAASAARAINISVGLPGITPETPPGDFIGKIYQFALLISGVLALGAIVYGGLRYMTAAGNPSGQNEGKEWIKGAIFGLMLLFGAYLILHFINPDITTLSLPTLTPIPVSQAPTTGETGGDLCGPTCTPPKTCSIQNGQPTCLTPTGGVSNCNGGNGCTTPGTTCVRGDNGTFFCQESSTACRGNPGGRTGCPSGQVCVRGLGVSVCVPSGGP